MGGPAVDFSSPGGASELALASPWHLRWSPWRLWASLWRTRGGPWPSLGALAVPFGAVVAVWGPHRWPPGRHWGRFGRSWASPGHPEARREMLFRGSCCCVFALGVFPVASWDRVPGVARHLLFLEMVVSFTSWAGELGEGKGHRRRNPRRGRKKNPRVGKIQLQVLLRSPVIRSDSCCC